VPQPGWLASFNAILIIKRCFAAASIAGHWIVHGRQSSVINGHMCMEGLTLALVLFPPKLMLISMACYATVHAISAAAW